MTVAVAAEHHPQRLIAPGIRIEPVDYNGVTYQIGQANNALLYPGLGLGTIVAGASKVTSGMLLAAAHAVAGQVDLTSPGASLLPPVENLRESSAITATAVVQAAMRDNVSAHRPSHPEQAVRAAMWEPRYS
ncbi:malic enzyme-like NAD(P)-binding protein [Streptomyces sp. NPDC001089]